jgi:hypothetical protein
MLNFGYNPDAVSSFEAPSGGTITINLGGSGGSNSSVTPGVITGSPAAASTVPSAGLSIIAILILVLLAWIAIK